MAIKMRVLCYTGKAKLKAAAELIKAEYDLSVNAVDTIPPAYSCNNERIVVLALTTGKEPDDTLRRFLVELTKARAQNIAIIADAKPEAVENVKKYLAPGGANIIEDVLYMPVGLFGGKKLSSDEEASLKAWIAKAIESLA